MGKPMTWLKPGVDILSGPLAQPLRNIHDRHKMKRPHEEDEPELAVLLELLQPGMGVASLGLIIGICTRFLSTVMDVPCHDEGNLNLYEAHRRKHEGTVSEFMK